MGLRILFALLFDTFLLLHVQSATFTVRNNCPSTIWPATLSGSGSQPLPSTGFELASKGSTTINVPAPWSGRVWARSHCTNTTNGRFTCGTGDCASQQVACNGAGGIPPATLIEFTIAASGGKDFYDVSLVDGFNLPVALIPEGQSGCGATSCPVDLNGQCPMELAIKDKSGSTIGCKSACFAFNQPEYCCTGGYNSPDTCKPSSYSLFFKERCPKAYSYAYDDKISIFTCSAGANYLITFCP